MRAAYFEITYGFLCVLVQGLENVAITSDLPNDAQIYNVENVPNREVIRVFYTSKTLDEVPKGHTLPATVPKVKSAALSAKLQELLDANR